MFVSPATQSAEPAGVLEINRDDAAEISVAGAAGGDAVPMAEPVDEAHSVVADEPEVAGAAWPEILEGVRLLKRWSEHDSGWSHSDRLAVLCPSQEHVRCARSRSVALQLTCWALMHFFVFLGVWLQAAWLTDVEHRAYIHARHLEVCEATKTRPDSDKQSLLFFSPLLLVESGKQHA